MDVELERVAYQWDVPLARTELPQETVYRALLCFTHDGDAQAVREALAPAFGRPRRRGLPWRPSFVFDRPGFRFSAQVHGRRAEVRSLHRLQPAALRRLVQALGSVPGARGLELHAEVPHFSKAFATLRACSPCQAKRL